MRVLVQIRIAAGEGSEAIKSGTMQKAIGAFIDKFKPEATYFTTTDGRRTGLFFVDMTAPQQMVEFGEPFFDIGCDVLVTPAMTPQDLGAGFASLGL